ncbi:DegQ family serine endoprotease [Undibacterium sp.]|uniref:DegQ family serine endoprotease n=1 Tax=Undibacterium sp. TaxID=1914977 RepID=UPI00374D749D
MKTSKFFPVEKLLSTLLMSACVGFIAPGITGSAQAQAAATSAVAGLPDFTDLVDKAGPAVVNIRTSEKISQIQSGDNDEQMQEFFRRFFGIPVPKQQQPTPAPKGGRKKAPQPQQEEQEVPRGVGSGLIISADGYILTNAHVVDHADEVLVRLTDKREFKAKVIGVDKVRDDGRGSDIAILKIEGTKLPHVVIGDSDKIRAGEWVIAIGSPFDLENTVTAGIISAKARDTGDETPLIQTDVAVNPGNSGGPLINMRGEVVGINSQIYSQSGGYMGISFAIPINEAMRVAEQLKTSGKVTRGRIGVQIQSVSKDIAESIGLKTPQGAFVAAVEPGAPAEKAGLQGGDVILKFNGVAIDKSIDLSRIVGGTKPGTKATVSVWRNGATREMSVTVAEVVAEKEKAPQKADKKSKKEPQANAIGLTVSDLTDAQKKDLHVTSGVAIETVEGAADRAGLQPGDVILTMNNVEVKDTKQFAAMLAKVDTKKAVVLLVRRDGISQFVPIRPLS